MRAELQCCPSGKDCVSVFVFHQQQLLLQLLLSSRLNSCSSSGSFVVCCDGGRLESLSHHKDCCCCFLLHRAALRLVPATAMRPSQHDGDSGKHCDVADQRTNSRVGDSSYRSSAHERRSPPWLGCKGSWQRPASLPQSFLRATVLQDFLARPPPTNATSSSTSNSLGLSPSVSLEIRLIQPDSTSAAASISPAFSDANRPPSPIGLFSSCSKKLTLLSEPPSDAGVERRHMRMLKNRESASRSRARKQAYVNQLELEIEQLLEENSKLKKELKKLSMEMAAQQLYPLKNKLQRSATAPF